MGVVVCSLGFMVSGIIMNITNANFRQTDKPTVIRIVESSQPIQAQTISTQEHTEQYSKLPYPFDTMSLDWSGEQIAGFKEYQIPDDYELYGGYFPLEMQEYTYIICKDSKRLSRTDERKSRKSAWNLMSSSRKKSRRLQH